MLIWSVPPLSWQPDYTVTSMVVSDGYFNCILIVMVNFIYQIFWATVSRYLVKHYFEYFGGGIFEWDIHLSQWTLSKSRLPSIMGGSHQKDWLKQSWPPLSKGNSLIIAFWLHLQHRLSWFYRRLPLNLKWISFLNLQVGETRHQILGSPSLPSCISQYLKINSFSIYIYPVGSVSQENPDPNTRY